MPHDWAIELPFNNDPDLVNKGFYPLGRKYPETSVGWYRRVFELPAEDAGKRITVEFDGAYRETMVVFNGFYIGRHSGGYDPFSFDLTDFVIPWRQRMSCWCAWMPRRATAGFTKARGSTAMSGW